MWSQQPSQLRTCSVAPAAAPHVQPRQPPAVLALEKPAATRSSTQLAPFTLEAYLQLHGVLTRGSQTVQQALPGDACKIKAHDLKQVREHPSEGISGSCTRVCTSTRSARAQWPPSLPQHVMPCVQVLLLHGHAAGSRTKEVRIPAAGGGDGLLCTLLALPF